MRALNVTAPWGPDAIKVVEAPDPTPGQGQVLVRMKACSLNYRDFLMINGMYGRGVLGAALALTHRQLRERNARYLTSLGCDRRIVAVLFKVGIMNEKPSPPDLTNPGVRLFQWEGTVLTD